MTQNSLKYTSKIHCIVHVLASESFPFAFLGVEMSRSKDSQVAVRYWGSLVLYLSALYVRKFIGTYHYHNCIDQSTLLCPWYLFYRFKCELN